MRYSRCSPGACPRSYSCSCERVRGKANRPHLVQGVPRPWKGKFVRFAAGHIYVVVSAARGACHLPPESLPTPSQDDRQDPSQGETRYPPSPGLRVLDHRLCPDRRIVQSPGKNLVFAYLLCGPAAGDATIVAIADAVSVNCFFPMRIGKKKKKKVDADRITVDMFPHRPPSSTMPT